MAEKLQKLPDELLDVIANNIIDCEVLNHWRTADKNALEWLRTLGKHHIDRLCITVTFSKHEKIYLPKYVSSVKKLHDIFWNEPRVLSWVKSNPDINIGEFIIKTLPPIELGRVAAQNAKGVIIQKVREADKSNQYEEYKDKVGEIAVGIVKRVEFGNLIIDLGKSEAIIKREELIPRETFKNGDRVRSYIYEVKNDVKGYQVFLSRTHPNFLSKLFFQEVPEIYEGVITVKSVARDPGSRAKISVYTEDSTIDPVGACVGMRGSRVQAVVNELQGEKIDIVTWSDNQATFLANALAPAEVSKIFLYEEKNKVEVVIPDDQLSLAIGRKGQNVKLASNLTNLEIDILTEDEESERRQQEFKDKSLLLSELLDVEDVIAQLLVTDGYTSIDSIATETLENIEKIEGFDSELAKEILQRSKNLMKDQEEANQKIIDENIKDDNLKNLEGMNSSILAKLANSNILTMDDFADLATFELIDKDEGILKDLDLDEQLVNKMIMKARENWFVEKT